MSSCLKTLKPNSLWKHFEEFLKIPRCSGNEKAIGDYIISVAKDLDLEWKRDDIGNIVISKKSSSGLENAEGVILQGHMDMVCEKNSDVDHDFTKDPIKAEIKGEWVKAIGTTLGADNGIGDCAALAILEDNTLIHPPLECLFTIDEERGLIGASRIQPGFLKGKRLLNLDSEDEGEFTIGCAGGADSQIDFPLEREKCSKGKTYKVKIYGLKGGHSGVDINKGRANAIKILSRLLLQMSNEIQFNLVSIDGGNLRNAIPREAWACLILEPEQKDIFSSMFQKEFESAKNEYKAVETEVSFSIEEQEHVIEDPLTKETQETLIKLLSDIPHGVISMHAGMKDLVETSTNLAVVRTIKNSAQIICSTRSSVVSALESTRNSIAEISKSVGAKIIQEEGYPGWTPNLQSLLLKTLKEVYKKTFNKDGNIAAIHAGLECGIIGEKFQGMDMISFGPTIKNPHSPDERVHIGTVEKFWEFLTKSLAALG